MAVPEVTELYKFVKQLHEKDSLNSIEISQNKLNVTLRPYQVQAIKWMIKRENYTDQFILEGENVDLPTGGILADEMGLGKTIEVLACILNNPKDDSLLIPRERKKRKKTRKHKLKESDDSDENYDSGEENAKKARIDDTIESVIKRVKRSSKGGVASGIRHEKYSMLVKWYEDSLTSLSPSKCSQPQKRVKLDKPELRCYCDQEPDDVTIAACGNCGHFLHLICAGVDYEPEEGTFFCPDCWPKMEPVASRATFIVTPRAIFQQWVSEIEKHIKGTKPKVYLYEGVKGNNYVQPIDLADNDIVITTYQVLQSELNYAGKDESEQRVLRYAKKYHTAKSPLPCVRWWRLCLDEAQMVESVAVKVAIMVAQLQATHRWGVTGTPIQKSINDLFGLIQYLKVVPYCNHVRWQTLSENQYEFYTLIGRLLWRSNKADVYHMLGVPDQKVVTHWLNFSPVEGYFYQRIHQECTRKFRERLFSLNDLNVPLKEVKRNFTQQLMIPLLKLRQACIHPQAVRGKYIRGSGKQMITMDELMIHMISQAKLDVEGALRTVVSCYNGKAGLNIILEQWQEAAKYYRMVLQFSEEFKNLASIDTLQMIHTLHNLAEVLKYHGDNIPPTLRDDKLLDDAVSLEESFLQKYDKNLMNTRVNVAKMNALVAEQSHGKTLGYSSWWEHVLKWPSNRTELIERIQTDLDDNKTPGQSSLSYKMKNIPAIHKEISVWLANADSLRIEVITALRKLELVPKQELSVAASFCHLDGMVKKKKKNHEYICHLCSAELSLKKYEAAIFSINKSNLKLNRYDQYESDTNDTDNKVVADLKEVKIHTAKKESSWKQAPQERILKVLSSYGKSKKFHSEWFEDSVNHLTLLETVRKEFKWLRAEWSALSHTVSLGDELEMAKLRLRLATPTEETDSRNKKDKLDPFVVRHVEVDAQMSKFEWDANDALVKLRKKAGVLLYLENLKKDGSVSQEACPICQETLNDKWSVLECGHCVCFQCIPKLMDMGSHNEIECPLCRMRTGKGDLSYVVASRETVDVIEGCADIKIKGSYSTKVEAITIKLLHLRQTDPDVKVLIFSTWETVLDVLCEALENNEITYRRFSTLPKYKNGLQQFKTKPITALLLPLRLGGKGLNIIEATHVFLVEPILNPADELQAAGRVHRIGQTRPTFVHRFVVEKTIEERMISSLEGVSSERSITLKQLDGLFQLGGVNQE